MSLDLLCNTCGASLAVEESQAGSIINCPSCGQIVFVQSGEPAQKHASDQPPLKAECAVPAVAAPHGIDLKSSIGPPSEAVARPAPSPLAEPGTASSLEQMLGTEVVPTSTMPANLNTFHPREHAAPAPPVDATLNPAVFGALPVDPAGLSGRPTKQRSRLGPIVAAYVSGAIVGLLLGRFLFGKAPPTGLEMIRDDGAYRKSVSQWITPTAPIPAMQQKRIGETIALGQLAVTALAVERNKVSLERLDPFSNEKEIATSAEECLLLRLRLRNESSDNEFAPLDEVFLRPHDPEQRPNYSYIELAGGEQIKMYELAQFSEWNIVGQPFTTIKPGEELEAIIAAASGSAERAKGRMVWRIQLRAGGYEDRSYSTVVGFEFTSDEVGVGD